MDRLQEYCKDTVTVASREQTRLEVLNGPEDGREFVIEADTIRIGRDDTNDFRVRLDHSVSRTHAQITRDEHGIYRLEDLGSKFGSSVNEAKLNGPVKLNSGDVISIGNTELVFRLCDAPDR